MARTEILQKREEQLMKKVIWFGRQQRERERKRERERERERSNELRLPPAN
jgi:hypothetical protein